MVEGAPLLKPELDITFSGSIARIEDARQTKHETVPALTLHLDRPTDDGDDYGVLLLGSTQLKRVIASAARRAGRSEISIGDWVSAGVVDKRETSARNTMNVWEAEYRVSKQSGPLGTGELGETDADDLPDF
ncbi:MAG: hypothetical protein ACM4D3_20285 [Candidatus Sericytochromatia bacterium]